MRILLEGDFQIPLCIVARLENGKCCTIARCQIGQPAAEAGGDAAEFDEPQAGACRLRSENVFDRMKHLVHARPARHGMHGLMVERRFADETGIERNRVVACTHRPKQRVETAECFRIGVVDEHRFHRTIGAVAIELAKDLRNGRKRELPCDLPVAVLVLAKAGILERQQAARQEALEREVPGQRVASHCGGPPAELQGNFLAGAVDGGVEEQGRVVDAIVIDRLGQRRRHGRRNFRAGHDHVGQNCLIVEGKAFKRLVLAQIGTAEAAILEVCDRDAGLVEEMEPCLDRVGADPLDLDRRAGDRPAGIDDAHGAETDRNIGSAAPVAREAVEECDQAVEGRVDRDRMKGVGDVGGAPMPGGASTRRR